MASLEPHRFPALVFHAKVNKHIKIIHIITRMDMGGSAQNTLLTALHHDIWNSSTSIRNSYLYEVVNWPLRAESKGEL